MRARGWIASAASLGLFALVALAFDRSPRADVIDPTVAVSIAIGDGNAIAPTDRGSPGRTARARSLPTNAKARWTRSLASRIDVVPVVAADGSVVVVTTGSGEVTLHELDALNGTSKTSTKLSDLLAAPVVILADGLRVLVTQKGDAIGVTPSGAIRFRTPLPSELASVAVVGLVPLASGGFAVERRGDLFELDAAGRLAGRVRIDAGGPHLLAARTNGDVVVVTSFGDLYTWRAGRLPRLVGTFSDRSPSGVVCPGGPIVDGEANPASGGRGDRAVCVGESLVESIDLASGVKRALLARRTTNLFPPFRTAAAIGLHGDVAVAGGGGVLVGVDATGNEYGPVDLTGSFSSPSKDSGVFVPSIGAVAPIVANDGSIVFGSSDGVAIATPLGVQRIARCPGSLGSNVVGVNIAGDDAIVLACVNGTVQLLADGPSPSP